MTNLNFTKKSLLAGFIALLIMISGQYFCLACVPGSCPTVGTVTCGDGIVDPGEECDPAGAMSGVRL